MHAVLRVREPQGLRNVDALLSAMVGPWPFKPYTFRALVKTLGPLWVRCDLCRRYARFRPGRLAEVDYRTKTFSCSRCGAEAFLCEIEPARETGMQDYRLDEREEPRHHPAAIDRLKDSRRAPRVDQAGGELPGRRVDPRR